MTAAVPPPRWAEALAAMDLPTLLVHRALIAGAVAACEVAEADGLRLVPGLVEDEGAIDLVIRVEPQE